MNKIKILKKVKMNCSICGEEHEVELCEELVKGIVKKEYVEHIEHYYRCTKYDSENCFMDGDMWNENLLNSIDAYRTNHNLLTSKEIKNIRLKYKLNQAELSLLAGFGEITITRYETKQVQEFSNDNILRMINNNAIFTLELLEKNKNKFSEKRYLEISGNIKEIIDTQTITYLKEQEIKSKYIYYNEKNELNGNCILDINKLNNILAYVTQQMNCIKKVVLMKILWYIDNLNYKITDHSITGLVYTHMPFGALPIAYDELLELPSIFYEMEVSENDMIEYKIYKNPDFKIVGISRQEKEVIDVVINKFKDYKSVEIAEYMHNEKAYKETKKNEIISFKFAKDLNIKEI